jgi:hypothetical protein
LFTDVCRDATLVAILERPETDVIRPLTSFCRVVKLPVMEVILVCIVFTLFCRLATAELALVAAVDAAAALLATVVRVVEIVPRELVIALRELVMPLSDVVTPLPQVVRFLPTEAMLVCRPVMLAARDVIALVGAIALLTVNEPRPHPMETISGRCIRGPISRLILIGSRCLSGQSRSVARSVAVVSR